MRRLLGSLLAMALATVALAGAALASPGTAADVELTVTPADPKAGDAVLIEAFVHFGKKPYQGANVEFLVTGAGTKTALNGKPGQPGFYRAQFTAQQAGAYEIWTKVDGNMVSRKPYHLQVAAGAPALGSEWLPIAAGGGVLVVLAALAGFLARRIRFARTMTATH